MQIVRMTLGNLSCIVTISESMSALEYQGHETGIGYQFVTRNAHRVPRPESLQSKRA